MKSIVIGDVHLKHDIAEAIASKFDDHNVIFAGDFFDDFGDTLEKVQQTAEWLKYSLSKPNRIHLYGNHDLPYHPEVVSNIAGEWMGTTPTKKHIINNVLTLDDWNKLKFFHIQNDWVISHAGFCEHWFANPLTGTIEFDKVDRKLNYSFNKLKTDASDNCIWALDRRRGGQNQWGSILWMDWSKLPLIRGVKQIVGHSPVSRIQKISDNVVNSHKINVDVGLKEILEIDENGDTRTISLY